MKKRLLSIVALMSAVSLIGCDDNFDEGGYSNVYPGIKIYESAEYSNGLAVDGLAVMIRFATLQAEMEASGIEFTLNSSVEPDWSELSGFDWNDYNDIDTRLFLFGSEENVALKMTQQDSFYTIDYGYDSDDFTRGSVDANYRNGVYGVETGGLSINETSQSNPWTLTIQDDGLMSLASDSSGSGEVSCYEMKVKFWCDDSAVGRYKFTYNTTFMVADDEDAEPYSWDTSDEPGVLEIEDFESFLIAKSIDKYFGFTFDCKGYTIYGDEMSYITTEPVLYNYSIYPGTRYGGKLEAEIYNLDSESFPSNVVNVEFTEEGYMFILYNGYGYATN